MPHHSGTVLRPLRLRSLLLLAVYLKVDLLIEEAQVSLHLGRFGYGVLVTPDEVLDALAVGLHRPVRRDTLIWTLGILLAWDELISPNVLRRDVVAWRQPRLEQELRLVGFRNDLAIDLDLHVAVAI